jgi:nucleoside-diphosphate-sugar epimerase
MQSVFITGAGGCVGHYVVDTLVEDYKLYLLIRNPDKLLFNPEHKNINIIHDDLDNISRQRDILQNVDYCIHIATVWGGEYIERINVQRVHELFDLLNKERIRRIIYFSTASILGRDMELLPEAERYGTDYIKTKSMCFRGLSECSLYDRIVTVFPTLVFGGDKKHPFSHLSKGLHLLKRFSWLTGRINIDIAFHFIHAKDIACIVKHLMEVPEPEKKYVLGNKAISFGEFTKKAARFFGYKINWQVKISPQVIYRLLKIIGARMSDWDRFCVEYMNFVYPVINCQTLGLPGGYNSVERIIEDWENSRINKKDGAH